MAPWPRSIGIDARGINAGADTVAYAIADWQCAPRSARAG
jgi:hypothetical protein